jgi:phage-related protein
MDGFYDFTALLGSWGPRTLTYTFDIVGTSIENMDIQRTAVLNWLCNVINEEIADDSIPNYHFRGSYESSSEEEDEEKSTITVNFICYPFKIANTATIYTFSAEETKSIYNNGMPCYMSINAPSGATISMLNTTQSVPASYDGKISIELPRGETEVTVTPTSSITGDTILSFLEEVL